MEEFVAETASRPVQTQSLLSVYGEQEIDSSVEAQPAQLMGELKAARVALKSVRQWECKHEGETKLMGLHITW
jgi:hypothetical protein